MATSTEAAPAAHEALGAPHTGLGTSAVYGVLALALEKLVALGIALYLPRYLALPDYGNYTLLVSCLGLFQALPDASLEAVLVTRLARAGDDPGRLAGRGALVRLAVSLGGAALGLGVLALVTGDRQLLRAGVIAAVGLAARAATPYRALLRARLRMGSYAVLLAGQALVAIGLLVVAVRTGGGLDGVLAAVSAGAFAGFVLGRLLVGRGARLGVDRAFARRLVVEAWPLAGTTLALLGAHQVLQLLLFRLHAAAEVGLLGAAQKLVEALTLAPQGLMLSVLPALSLAAVRPGRAAGAAREAARVLVIVLVPAAALLSVWATPILAGLFGPSFSAAAPVLRVLAPAALLGATGTVLSNLLLALGLQQLLLRVTAGSAVVMIALGVSLVPSYGAVGAGAAFVAALLAGQLALLALPATRAHAASVLGAMPGPVLLGALAAAVAAKLGSSTVSGAGLLLILYLAALFATRSVTRVDLQRWRLSEDAER